jgi:prephenate dehydrogenase
MAGSEKSGIAHAEAMLFEGKTCILTPMDAPPDALSRLRSLWKALGMTLLECSPQEHDRIVAYVSHLPHALAAALCKSLADLPAEWRACAGAGLKDTSRVAAGDPRLWSAIFRENEAAFRESLNSLRKSLSDLEVALDEDSGHSLRSFLEKAQAYRIGLDSDTPKGAAEAKSLRAQESRNGLDPDSPPSSFSS